MSQATGSPGEASERRQHALDLFAGLPRRYDPIGALLARLGGRVDRRPQQAPAADAPEADDRRQERQHEHARLR
jgi:hypothetical protein